MENSNQSGAGAGQNFGGDYNSPQLPEQLLKKFSWLNAFRMILTRS
jgi:hypothetical protein